MPLFHRKRHYSRISYKVIERAIIEKKRAHKNGGKVEDNYSESCQSS